MQTIFYYLAQRVFTILSCLSDNILIPFKKKVDYYSQCNCTANEKYNLQSTLGLLLKSCLLISLFCVKCFIFMKCVNV